MFEVETIARLAQAAGKSHGVGEVVMTHGETDSGNTSYKPASIKLMDDHNGGLSQTTGSLCNRLRWREAVVALS